ncbi:hypothetical protein BJV77DRAFT_1067239 [Russula vinacea]|nr:hypothetical protein BJV77DRAFT_1067239 [Russula vinacea]
MPSWRRTPRGHHRKPASTLTALATLHAIDEEKNIVEKLIVHLPATESHFLPDVDLPTASPGPPSTRSKGKRKAKN